MEGVLTDSVDVAAFERDIRAARSHAAVQERYRAEIARFGYTEAACGYFQITRMGAATHFYFQDWPQAWIEIYVAEGFVNHDFVVSEARRRLMPFRWSDVTAARQLTLGESRILAAALPFGWTDGFCVPVHGPGGYFGLITTAGKPGELHFEALQGLHLISLHTHERCRQIAGVTLDAKSGFSVTARELECLRWVALGLDDRAIGSRLGISPLTVKDYLASARLKLGAETRAQAVAMLVACGLL